MASLFELDLGGVGNAYVRARCYASRWSVDSSRFR